MGTQSAIGYRKNGQDKITVCFSDGYPQHNGIMFLAMLRYSPELFQRVIDAPLDKGDYLGNFGLSTSFYRRHIETVQKHFPDGLRYKRQNPNKRIQEKKFSLIGEINVDFNKERPQNVAMSFDYARTEYGFCYFADIDNKQALFLTSKKWTMLSFNQIKKFTDAELEKLLINSIDLSFYLKESSVEIIPNAISLYNEYYRALEKSNLNTEQGFEKMLKNSICILNDSHIHNDVLNECAQNISTTTEIEENIIAAFNTENTQSTQTKLK